MREAQDSVTTTTHQPVPRDSSTTDGHRLGPGWLAATVIVILIVSVHPIRRWRRERRRLKQADVRTALTE